MRSFIPLYHAKVTILVKQSTFYSEFSSTLLVAFAVLGAPTEGYQKVLYGSLFWYYSQLQTMETDLIAFRTVLNRTARWKQAIIVLDPTLK